MSIAGGLPADEITPLRKQGSNARLGLAGGKEPWWRAGTDRPAPPRPKGPD